MKIAITGANGFVGKYLTHYFGDKGIQVLALQRTLMSDEKNIHVVKYSLQEKPDKEIFKGITHLIHCAVQHEAKNLNARQINADAANYLIAMAQQYNFRIIFLSSLSAHKEAESQYGRNKLELESMFAASHHLVIKSGLVIGQGGLYGTIESLIKKSSWIPLIAGHKLIQTISLEDLAKVIENGITKNLNGVYPVAEDKAISLREMYLLIASHGNHHIRFLPVPLFIALMISRVGEMLNIPLPISSESVLGLKHLKTFDTSHSPKVFGVPIHSIQETLKRLHE